MSLDIIILILIWTIGVLLFVCFTQKRKRKLLLAFLICQCLLWASSLVYTSLDLIAFPIREFPIATDLLVTTEYFFYPLLCGFYIIYEPKGSFFFRVIYLSICTSLLVSFDVILERYTNLIEYVQYGWYWIWISFFWLFAFTNYLYIWFFQDQLVFRAEKRITK